MVYAPSFSKGFRCAQCGGKRTDASRHWCRECFDLMRDDLKGRPPGGTGVKPIISPWETLPNGDRVRTISG